MLAKPQKLLAKDYDEILDVWEASVLASHHFLQPSEINYYRPLIRKYGLPECEVYGLHGTQNKLSGFISVKNKKIEMLFVHPDFFNQGMGRTLAHFAITELGCTLIDVNEENPKAYAIYKHWGFRLVSRDELDDCGKPHPILHLSL